MRLLADVGALLQQRGAPYAVIGAGALAVLGASRATQDLDLLTTDRRVLSREFWSLVTAAGAQADVRVGDASDPLAGVVRLCREGERPVDVIVGEAPWQDRLLADAAPHQLGTARVPVVDAAGLVLLKLYAGGPQDCWDIEQVLALVPSPASLIAEVSERVLELPPRCRRLWRRITAASR